MGEISTTTIILLLVMGGFGALVKEILGDNKLTLPRIANGELYLGFIGSIIIGALVGYLVDHSPLMAFFAGYTGFSALGSLIPKTLAPTDCFEPDKKPVETETEPKKEMTIKLPFDGDYRITQKFGENPAYYEKAGFAGHFGIDYATPFGTPIQACDNGEVNRSGSTTGNGNFCEISHSWGKSLYCHLKATPCVKIGDKIKRGQVIGFAGNTGAVIPQPTKENPLAGTHLHFSISITGVLNPDYKNYLDPTPFFEKVV